MARAWLKEMEIRNRIMRYPMHLVESAMAEVEADDEQEVFEVRDIDEYDEDELQRVLDILRAGRGESVAASMLRLAKAILAKENPLNGMSRSRASRFVNKVLSKHTKGFFRDTAWQAVHRVWKDMDDAGLEWNLTDNYYTENEEGIAASKTWKFEVEFLNNRERLTKLSGVIIASGAGSVEDPLDRYDLVAYVS